MSLMKNKLKENATLVENKLSELLTSEKLPYMTLLDSMSYSTLAGGKRVRPYLVLEFCELCGKEKRLERLANMARLGLAITDGLFMSSRDGYNFKKYDEALIPPPAENP